MMPPNDLRRAIRESRLSISAIASMAGLPRTTLYSFVSGDTKSLRASAQLAIQEALGLRYTPAVREDRAPFDPNLQAEAKALGLDPEAIAAKAVEAAIKQKRFDAWIDENREIFEAKARDVDENGLWCDKYRLF